jgi:hypothetical protein
MARKTKCGKCTHCRIPASKKRCLAPVDAAPDREDGEIVMTTPSAEREDVVSDTPKEGGEYPPRAESKDSIEVELSLSIGPSRRSAASARRRPAS